MPCPSADVLAAVISGNISEADRAEFWQHADQCDVCREVCSHGMSVGHTASVSTLPAAGPSRTIVPGDSLGRYILLYEIGRGGLGIVFAAYDPTLDRNVAIKILSHGAADPTLLIKEARTLAKLSHPNIVPVHDVGVEQGCAYIAVEYIVGQTLRHWMTQAAGHTWTEVRTVFLKIAAALQFAHEKGVVHLDLKPENVLLDNHGHVHVSDFGLARFWATPTVTPTIAGTPAYMAPEQARNGNLGPFTDQYAFCVTLAEALCGVRPDGSALKPKVKVPPAVLAALKVGLAEDPKQRFESMAALARQLDGYRSQRRTVVIGAAILTIGGAAAMWATRSHEPSSSQRCTADADRATQWWAPTTTTDVAESLFKTATFQSRQVPQQIAKTLEQYVRGYATQSAAACTRLHTRGETTPALFARQQLCLSQGLSAAQTLTGLLLHSDATLASNAALAVATLPLQTRCADATYLLAKIVPPTADQATEVAALRGLFAQATAYQLIGQFQKATTIVDDLATKAQTLGYQPLIAEVLFLQADLRYRSGDAAAAATGLQRAATLAAQAKDDELSARAWTLLAGVVGYAQGKAAEGHSLATQADAWLVRAANPPDVDADLAEIHALLFDVDGKLDEAKPFYEKALRVRQELYGAQHLLVAQSLNNLAAIPFQRGQLDEAQALHQRALAIRIARLGEVSPDVAVSVNALAQIDAARGDLDKARLGFERAIAIWSATIGADHTDTAAAHNELGNVLRRMARLPEATTHLTQAMTIWQAKLGADHPNTLSVISNLASVYYDSNDATRALALFDKVVARRQATLGAAHPSVASALVNRSRVLAHIGKWELAAADATAAATIYEAAQLPADAARALTVLADVELGRTHFATAKQVLARALPVLAKSEGSQEDFAAASFTLAQAEWALHNRQQALAAAARALSAAPNHAKIRQWITSKTQ